MPLVIYINNKDEAIHMITYINLDFYISEMYNLYNDSVRCSPRLNIWQNEKDKCLCLSFE